MASLTRTRMEVAIDGRRVVITSVICELGPMFYDGARWRRETMIWQMDCPAQIRTLAHFIAALADCPRTEYVAAHTAYVRYKMRQR